MVEFLQLLPNGLIELIQGEELLVAQRGDDPSGDAVYTALGIRLIPRFTDSRRDDGCTIVFRHLVIHRIEPLILVATVVQNSRLGVVRHKDACNAAKVAVHVCVRGNP